MLIFHTIDISDSIVSREPVLTLTDINGTVHGGTYTCIAFNTAGTDLSDSVIYVTPEFIHHPSSVNATSVNEMHTLTCTVDGYPLPTIQWQKRDIYSGTFTEITGETENTLNVFTSDPQSSGTYRCLAVSSLNYTVYSNPAIISIPLDGTVSVSPQTVDLDYDTSLTLNCSVEGGPDNVFEWLFNGTSVPMDHVNVSTSPFHSLLSIDHLSAPLHGGTFVCQVSNAISQDSNATTVYIKPRFLEYPSPSIMAAVGTSRHLNCTAESYPYPRYTWKRVNDSITVLEGSSVLVFDPVAYDDMGYYMCVVESYSTIIESDIAVVHG